MHRHSVLRSSAIFLLIIWASRRGGTWPILRGEHIVLPQRAHYDRLRVLSKIEFTHTYIHTYIINKDEQNHYCEVKGATCAYRTFERLLSLRVGCMRWRAARNLSTSSIPTQHISINIYVYGKIHTCTQHNLLVYCMLLQPFAPCMFMRNLWCKWKEKPFPLRIPNIDLKIDTFTNEFACMYSSIPTTYTNLNMITTKTALVLLVSLSNSRLSQYT